MKKILVIFLAVLLTYSCEKEDAGSGDLQIKGYVQKGPFVLGSEVRIQELTSDLSSTGKAYYTQTNDDFGSFETNSEIGAGYIDIATTGFYFNEVEGRLSNSYITLKSISYLSETTDLNVNILTTLAFDRIKYLLTNENYSFSEARTMAQNEVLNVFNIEVADSIAISFEEMDISKSGVNNSILLAISSILQFGNSEAELSELINKFSDDIKEDGILNSETIKAEISSNSMNLDVDMIIENLEKRYGELGVGVTIPEFGNYIDSDGDGMIDLYQTPKPKIGPKSEMMNLKPVLVSLTTDSETEIYYTIDGTDPDINSTKYVEPFKVGLDGKDVTVKAIAYTDGLKPSAIASEKYTFLFKNAFSPKYSIMAGTYSHDLSLELYSETEDVDIYYTTDGSTPDVNSTKYSGPISIEGDNSVLNIKAIAIHQHLKQSIVSASYYMIDYGFYEDQFIEGLTVSDYNSKLEGKWIGSVSAPWALPYNIEMEIFSNGTYSARAISSYKYLSGEEVLYPAFYYGTDDDSDSKTIEINDLYATGKAKGEIVIFFDPYTTNTGELRNVSFYNDYNTLQFEFWHRGEFGPLKYTLMRLQ